MAKTSSLRAEAETKLSETDEMAKARKFLADLTEISAKHGIGIAGEATLFLMEPEDFSSRYAIDDHSRLYRT